MQPSIWIVGARGVDDHAHLLGADDAFDLDGALLRVDRDLGDGGHVAAGVDAARHAVAAPAG